MWAIGQNAGEITALGPTHQFINAIEEIIRRGEAPNARSVRMDDHSFQIDHPGQLPAGLGGRALDLQVARAAVEELRKPRLSVSAGERVRPIGLTARHRVVDFSGCLDQFRRSDLHPGSRRA